MAAIVLDANVLYSNLLRGLFLWLSKFGLCRPVWSLQIWDEVFRNHPGDETEKRQFRNAIEQGIFPQFPDSMRPSPENYKMLGLPDQDDEHVAALARQENIPTVVTFNLKDFPAAQVEPMGVRCIHPDEFLCELYGTHKDVMNAALSAHLQNLTRTKPTKAAFIEGFRKANVVEFATYLEKENVAGNLPLDFWA